MSRGFRNSRRDLFVIAALPAGFVVLLIYLVGH
jgi:hypothetical protein